MGRSGGGGSGDDAGALGEGLHGAPPALRSCCSSSSPVASARTPRGARGGVRCLGTTHLRRTGARAVVHCIYYETSKLRGGRRGGQVGGEQWPRPRGRAPWSAPLESRNGSLIGSDEAEDGPQRAGCHGREGDATTRSCSSQHRARASSSSSETGSAAAPNSSPSPRGGSAPTPRPKTRSSFSGRAAPRARSPSPQRSGRKRLALLLRRRRRRRTSP
uniref:Uncharacterized protein n=1 Tax=Oryza sativa subsp. japonica TaxID=39947 RepID=Q6K6P5_ORYSJ|nr:hypothetical protein [Oryza sativa Japonica Group]